MKRIFTIFAFVILIASLFAQAPEKMNYQAIIRNSDNQLVSNQQVNMRFSILQGTLNGIAIYVETHAQTTNANGLVTIEIGSGSVINGDFANIDWTNGPYYIKAETDPTGGTNYTITGTSQLLSVPYAFHANTADSITGSIVAAGITASDTTKWNKAAQKVDVGLVTPTVTTLEVTNIGTNNATFAGTVTDVDLNQIGVTGFVITTYSNHVGLFSNKAISIDVDIENTFTTSTNDTILFQPSIKYYARAYVIMKNGAYFHGNEVSFTTTSVGQEGAGSGIVFYDKGYYSDGWRFIELAPTDQSNNINWGCKGISIPGTSLAIGTGKDNSALIIGGCGDANFAAKICDNLILGGKDDWFLPSYEELFLLRDNLLYKTNKPDNFVDGPYWSSSESSSNSAYTFYFSGLYGSGGPKDFLGNVRAIRYY